MTIFDGTASLCVNNDTDLASAVSDVLSLTPVTVGEVGDPKTPVRFDAEGVAQRQYFDKQATWILDVWAAELPALDQCIRPTRTRFPSSCSLAT